MFPDDAFLLVSQLHWEDDVVWNGEDIKHKVRKIDLTYILVCFCAKIILLFKILGYAEIKLQNQRRWLGSK